LTRTQLLVLAVIAAPLGGFYVIESFINPNPVVRIVLRTAPVLPAAIWTLWLDRSLKGRRRLTALDVDLAVDNRDPESCGHVRELPVASTSFVIVYEVNEALDAVIILRVVHGAQRRSRE